MLGFKKGYKEFNQNIIAIVNSTLLSIVYLIGVGITSIISKIARKRFLDVSISKDKTSYWENLDLRKEAIEKYRRQF